MWLPFVGLILFVLAFQAQVAAQRPEPQFTIIPDVQYCTGGGRPLLMDIFVPKLRNQQ